MCLYPKLLINRKYVPTKKNNYNPPELVDERVKWVSTGCGQCIECRNQKKREWQIRLHEEFKHDNTGKFVTLTFSDESLRELERAVGKKECNAVATLAVHRFRERWRKSEKKSPKHWLVTELGHENTERIHLHGIIFTEKGEEYIKEKWKYGNIYIGEYCNEKTVNYIVKYVSKQDEKHPGYKSVILTSPGIGKGYMNRTDWKNNRYKKGETKETYRLPNGAKTALPIYYRNKIYTEEQRELLWLEKIEKEQIYVCGEKINISTESGQKEYYDTLQYYRRKNRQFGYGDDKKEWKFNEYNTTLKEINNITKKLRLKTRK